MIPRGRWNQPEDLVGAVLFLSSPLSDMVVGRVMAMAAGQSTNAFLLMLQTGKLNLTRPFRQNRGRRGTRSLRAWGGKNGRT